MFPLIEFPELVQHYAPHFADVFSVALCYAKRCRFLEYYLGSVVE